MRKGPGLLANLYVHKYVKNEIEIHYCTVSSTNDTSLRVSGTSITHIASKDSEILYVLISGDKVMCICRNGFYCRSTEKVMCPVYVKLKRKWNMRTHYVQYSVHTCIIWLCTLVSYNIVFKYLFQWNVICTIHMVN